MRANAVNQLYEWRKEEEIRKIDKSINSLEKTDLWEVKWLWPATIKTLIDKNIKTKAALKETKMEVIKKIITNPISLKWVVKFLNEI